MKRIWRENSLSIVTVGLFLTTRPANSSSSHPDCKGMYESKKVVRVICHPEGTCGSG